MLCHGHGAVGVLRRLDRLDVVADGQRQLRSSLDEGLELRVAGNEVGLGVHLDHRRASRSGCDADQPVGGNAARALGRGGQPLLAQPVHGELDLAAGLGQRLLAVQYARAGLVAQVLHQGSGDLWHGFALLSGVRFGDGFDVRHGFRGQVLGAADIRARGLHLGADPVQHRTRHQVAV